MHKIRLSIQISIIVVAVFFLIGLFVSFVIFCLCRFDMSKKVHVEIEMPTTVSNKNNETNMEQTQIELFEIRKNVGNENYLEKFRELSIKSENNVISPINDLINSNNEFNVNDNDNTIAQNNYQIINENNYYKNAQFKSKQQFRLKSQSLDLSHINSKYMRYGKRSPIYKNYLIKSNRSFLGYEPNESSN